ncbi:hypothetical protein ACTA71_004577 [Dictyostelium dimigraforme]
MKLNNNNINNNNNNNNNNISENNNIYSSIATGNYGSPSVVGSFSSAAMVPDMMEYNSEAFSCPNAPTNYTSYLISLYHHTLDEEYMLLNYDENAGHLNNYGSMFELMKGSDNSNSSSPSTALVSLCSSSQTVPSL